MNATDARTTPPCVICGRLTCADYRTCRGELAALCGRVEQSVAEFVIWPDSRLWVAGREAVGA